MSKIKNTKDRLSWLLRPPVILIWLDQERHIQRWQMSIVSDAMLKLPHNPQSIVLNSKEVEV